MEKRKEIKYDIMLENKRINLSLRKMMYMKQ